MKIIKIIIVVAVALLIMLMLGVIVVSLGNPYTFRGDFMVALLPVALIVLITGVVTSIYAYRTQNSKRAIRIFLVVTALLVVALVISLAVPASLRYSSTLHYNVVQPLNP